MSRDEFIEDVDMLHAGYDKMTPTEQANLEGCADRIKAEYDRLRAEVEMLKQERDAYFDRLREVRIENALLEADVERLRKLRK